MNILNLSDDLIRKILSYIPYCNLKFNYDPGLINKRLLNIFRISNSKCDYRYLLYEIKFCIKHNPNFLKGKESLVI